jgi:hypothetical protein
MQNNSDSEHIRVHDCNHHACCPEVYIQTNFGKVNMNSHNTHTSQMDNCGNRRNHTNQCGFLLLLISCCPQLNQIPFLKSLTLKVSMKAHVRLKLTVSTNHSLAPTLSHTPQLEYYLSRFSSPNSYYRPPFPYFAVNLALHRIIQFSRLYDFILSNVHRHGLHINCIDQKSYSI